MHVWSTMIIVRSSIKYLDPMSFVKFCYCNSTNNSVLCPAIVLKIFCPILKNFVHPAGHVWHGFSRRFQCYWLHVNVFPTVYNLATRRATPRRKSLLEAFIGRIKKPVLNPTLTLTLTLVLRAKHNDVFHCLYEGKFLVSLRRSRVGPA